MINAILIELDAVAGTAGPPPGACEALAAVRALEPRPGRALAVGFVGGDLAGDAAVDRLRALGFEQLTPDPAAVTTAAVAGAPMPDRRLFQAALRRLGVAPTLSRSAIVLGGTRHAAACRALRMGTLAFGADFTDWRDLPLLVAARVDPASLPNLAVALGPWLAPDLEDVTVARAEQGLILVRARAWARLPAGRLPDGVHAKLPVEVVVRLDEAGRARSVEAGSPPLDAVAEAASHAESLFARGEVAAEGRPSAGTTHVLETDARGRRLLKRTRFSR